MNCGIEAARGAYIGIVEPDDFPERDMFKRLLRMAQRHDCDLVKCNFFEHYEDHDDRIRNFADFPYGRLFDPVEQPRIVCTIPAIWTGLYRKAWLDDEGIRFRETPGASFQDTSFVMKSWFAARRCALVRKPLLHYRMDNPGSSVKTTSGSCASVLTAAARCCHGSTWTNGANTGGITSASTRAPTRRSRSAWPTSTRRRGKQASSICSCSILSAETFSANCSTAGRRSSQPTIRKHIRKLS